MNEMEETKRCKKTQQKNGHTQKHNIYIPIIIIEKGELCLLYYIIQFDINLIWQLFPIQNVHSQIFTL